MKHLAMARWSAGRATDWRRSSCAWWRCLSHDRRMVCAPVGHCVSYSPTRFLFFGDDVSLVSTATFSLDRNDCRCFVGYVSLVPGPCFPKFSGTVFRFTSGQPSGAKVLYVHISVRPSRRVPSSPSPSSSSSVHPVVVIRPLSVCLRPSRRRTSYVRQSFIND